MCLRGTGIIHDGFPRNRGAARDKRDPKAEGVQAEGRRPEVGDLNTSAFSLLHLSRFSRQSRPSRLNQAMAIAAEVLMNNAGQAHAMNWICRGGKRWLRLCPSC